MTSRTRKPRSPSCCFADAYTIALQAEQHWHRSTVYFTRPERLGQTTARGVESCTSITPVPASRCYQAASRNMGYWPALQSGLGKRERLSNYSISG